MKLKQLFWFLLFFSIAASAVELDNTTISVVMLDKNHGDRVFIDTEAAHPSGEPSCHSSAWSYVMPLTNELENKLYSAILTAYASGKKVKLYGNGQCDVYSSIETLRRIELK